MELKNKVSSSGLKANVSSIIFNEIKRIHRFSIAMSGLPSSFNGRYCRVSFGNNDIVISTFENREDAKGGLTVQPLKLTRKTKTSSRLYLSKEAKNLMQNLKDWGCHKWIDEDKSSKCDYIIVGNKIIISTSPHETSTLQKIAADHNIFINGIRIDKNINDDGLPVYTIPDCTPSIHTEMVSPQAAEKLLKLNFKNRNIKPLNMKKIIDSIMNGTWDSCNGETIKINIDNELVDGQHRLRAIIATGITIPVTFCTNVSTEAQGTIDSGRARNGGDVLAIEGHHSPDKLATVSKKLAFLTGETISNEYKANCTTTWTNNDIIEYTKRNVNDIEKALDMFNPLISKSGSVCRRAICVSLSIIFMRKNEKKAKQFIEEVFGGYNLTRGSATSILREKLIEAATRMSKNSKNRMDDHEVALWFIKTWNAHVAEAPLKASHLKLNTKKELPKVLGG